MRKKKNPEKARFHMKKTGIGGETLLKHMNYAANYESARTLRVFL